MAKKKEEGLTYLQMPLPSGRKSQTAKKRSWAGFNKRQTVDTGELSAEMNISTLEAPYLVPSQKPRVIYDEYTDTSIRPISLFGFEDFLIMIYKKDRKILLDYIAGDGNVYTGLMQESSASYKDEYQRCVLQFNKYDVPTDPIDGKFIKKLIILPDRKSMDFHFETLSEMPDEPENGVVYCIETNGVKIYRVYSSDGGYEDSIYFPINDLSVYVKEYYNSESETDEGGATIYPPPKEASHSYYYKNKYNQDVYIWSEFDVIDDDGNKTGETAQGWRVTAPPSFPPIKYGVVYLSRLFGVDDDRIYASGYNDYTNWNFDTAGEYNESNAWCTPAQANTKAGGIFTGITAFQSHVICFKSDYMHELYNTKNPFRLQDIFAEGAIDHRTIQDVDGRLIFVSEDGVKLYTGSNPRIIDYNLNMTQYRYAAAGTDNRCYYLYCEDENHVKRLFVYDTYVDEWSEREIEERVLSFAHNTNGMYMLTKVGEILQLDTDIYSHNWSFETDLITNETVNIKHIKKLQMLADMSSGSRIQVYILYDDEEFNEDTSHLAYSGQGGGKKAIRVRPRRTAHYGFKLHVEGFGYVRLYELEIGLEAGGDMYVTN